MNSDQINSLIRSILKIAGAALAAHGLTKAAAIVNAEDTIGVVMTLTALVMSHWSHGTDKTKGTNAIGVFVWLLLPALLFTGCQTQLDPTGIYRTQFGALGPWMYTQDNAVDTAVQTVDAAEKWELQNHAYLVTNSPNVVILLQLLRIQSKSAIQTYYQERQNLAALMSSTNAPEMVLAVSNSIVTTVGAINQYSSYQERQNLAALMSSTNDAVLVLAVSNSIFTTVGAINQYSGKASTLHP